MKSGARDRAEGTIHELKGKAKEIAGKATDNPKLEAEGGHGNNIFHIGDSEVKK